MAGNVLFFTESDADVDQFIAEYVLNAIDRVATSDRRVGLSFDRDEPLNPEGGSVALILMGDFEWFVEHERDRWQEYREAGVITEWKTQSVSDEQATDRFGEQGAELAQHLMPLAGQMGKLTYETFDGAFPPAADAYPDEDGAAVGWWLVLHHLTVGNLGYSPREELQMYRQVLDHDLRLIAERDGGDAVDAEIDALIDELEQMRDKVKEGRPQS